MREIQKMNVWNDKTLTLIYTWLVDLTGLTWPKYNNIKILFFYKSRQYKLQLGSTSRVYAWYKYNKNIFRRCSIINTLLKSGSSIFFLILDRVSPTFMHFIKLFDACFRIRPYYPSCCFISLTWTSSLISFHIHHWINWFPLLSTSFPSWPLLACTRLG